MLAVLVVLASGLTAPEPGSPGGPFVTDRFGGSVLGSHWQPVTPHGVGDVQLAESGRGEQWLALSVPDGVNHHPWTTNDTVRAVQAVWDRDLRVQAGFGSVPFARYQMQGLTVAASEDTFLRYEVHHDGAGLRLFAGLTVDGVPSVVFDTELPALDQVHLQVTREGSDWELSWSPDGTGWSVGGAFSQRMTVAEVGPFAGSFDRAGNAVAFTALVDYVADTAGSAPAVPESPAGPDPAAPSVTGSGADPRARSARLTWATDEVTTGRVEYGPTDAYGEQSDRTPAGLGHARTLPDLEPDTSYHYRVVATDLSGNVTTTEDAVFTTAADSPAGRLVSDNFAGTDLDPHWEPVRPLGVGEVGRTGPADVSGQLLLSVPAGHNHDPWTANDSVRAVQALADEDLSIEARFSSIPVQRNQMQGLTVGESRVTFLRFGVHSAGAGAGAGSGLRLFGAVTHDGTPTVVVDVGLPALEAVSLRVARTGDDWELSWSADGATWTSAAVFSQRMVISEAGPFAGSYDKAGAAPAFTALVDHVHETGSPDGGGAPGGPPEVQNVSVDTSTNIVLVRWLTSTEATGQVELGTDDSYGDTSQTTTAGTVHGVQLADLERDTTYHYRLVATDPDGQVVRTEDATFTTAAGNTGPTIDVWYGREQVTGPVAPAQQWVNVLGNVRDPDGVSSLRYSVNGNGPRPLTLGPDTRRLQWPGDFNADIPVDDLAPGTNEVTITATDGQGAVTTVPVTVQRGSDADTDLPYQVSWSGGRSPATQAQVVDGRWTVLDGGLRTGRTGYDRVVAVGDLGWSDYEVTVPITVHELGPAAYSYLSGGPMIGVGLRWRGHTAVDDKQPAWGFYPTGAFAWYRFHEGRPRFELSGDDGKPTVHTSPLFEIGTTYLLKVRVETVGDVTRYQAKLWSADGPEPGPGLWDLEIEQPDGPESGSVALVAHQLDGTFGDVTVRPL
ncbi:MAG: hypothetical protein GEV12_08715 [Micromonosporaceae bacterium]|nr:hypothetical protein [Micromonosporaceae bacterium]